MLGHVNATLVNVHAWFVDRGKVDRHELVDNVMNQSKYGRA